MIDFKIKSPFSFKSNYLLPIVTIIGLLITFYFPVLSGKQTLFAGDISMAAYPWKFLIYKAIHEQSWPFWNPYIFGGMPFLSTLHPGVFYPLNIVFLIEDFTYALNLYFFLHHVILSLSVYVLCRHWKLSWVASICASAPTFFGGYFLSLLDIYNHFASLVWLPLIFLCFQKFLSSKKAVYFLASVFLLLFPTLAGGPENCAMIVLLLAGYSVFVLSIEDTSLSILNRMCALAFVVFSTLVISAIQIIPSFIFIKESGRGQGLDFEAHSKWSMEPSSLWKLIVPENFSNNLIVEGNQTFQFLQSFYCGILPILFLILAFKFMDDRKVKFWLGTFFLGLFCALGQFNPVYEKLYPWVPLLKMFRYPEKYFFICQFSLIFLTGYVVDLILKRKINNRLIYGLSFFLLISIGLVAHLKPSANWQFPFIILILFCLWTLLTNLKEARPFLVVGILPLFLLIDVFLSNAPLIPMINSDLFNKEPVITKKLNKTKEPFRIYSGTLDREEQKTIFPKAPQPLIGYQLTKEFVMPNWGTVFDLEYADGWSSMYLENVEIWKLIFNASPEEKRKHILERSNVRYQINYEIYSGRSDEILRLLDPEVIFFDKSLPRAFLVPNFQVEKIPHIINVYYDKKFDPRKRVLFSEPINWKPSQSFSGNVESISYKPNKVKIETKQTGKAFLVLLDSWFPGWKATVDGKTSAIYRANYFYRAVALESGNHIIEFDYEPKGWRLGKTISILSLFILMVGILKFRKKMEF